MKMTVREAIKYIGKGDGMKFTQELYTKVESFLHKLPRNPELDKFGERTICDYNEGWFARIQYGKDEDGNLYVQVDGDNLDPNPNRVKSNEEALQVIAEIQAIRYADDIDQYWNMSDDHKYWRRMSELNRKASFEHSRLIGKLR